MAGCERLLRSTSRRFRRVDLAAGGFAAWWVALAACNTLGGLVNGRLHGGRRERNGSPTCNLVSSRNRVSPREGEARGSYISKQMPTVAIGVYNLFSWNWWWQSSQKDSECKALVSYDVLLCNTVLLFIRRPTDQK
nr:uncharacterized protein LOC109783885 [Aegilops tauschii subsp. strangulata]